MGRKRSKYVDKQDYKTVVDESQQKKIKLDLTEVQEDKYDSSNILALPSDKRKTKKQRSKNAQPVKLLSKKQRKKLEKIVDQKQKKEHRGSVLAELEKLQADSTMLSSLIPYEVTQTLGRKKYLADGYTALDINSNKEEDRNKKISAIKGVKRFIKQKIKNPNVVEIKNYNSSSSEDESSDDETEKDLNMNQNSLNSQPNKATVNKDEADVKTEEKYQDLSSTKEESEREHSNLSLLENTRNSTVINKEICKDNKLATYVMLDRSEEIQRARLKLPILSEEQVVMEAINENLLTIIYGPTGSGKTTQVPQFLYEAGYTSNGMMIGVTEPRRVAAISMSQRVAYEMNLSSKEISYQIRFEGNVTEQTKIKFMTDGVLLKEMQKDPSLRKYSAIVIDEAHERSVHSDILIGFLTRIVVKRHAKGKPLKLIIMSATLRIEDFTENQRLLRDIKPPVVKVDSRMFEVSKHFNKNTKENYLEAAYKKVCKIHRSLPEGGVLVFLTGQQEIHTLMRWLSKTFPHKSNNTEDESHMISGYRKKRIEAKEHFRRFKKGADATTETNEQGKNILLSKITLSDFNTSLPENEEEEHCNKEFTHSLEDMGSSDEEEDITTVNPTILRPIENEQPLYILPLYSMLPPNKQKLVFQPPPEGTRLCVVATNVAETSLTIPNIKYVVDAGKVKEKVYDKVTGVSTFHITWISQASAEQRAGRAGRTAPGHCYRLYSSAVYNEFEKFSMPEIKRRPIDDVVLLMKSMSLPVVNFPYPTPPESVQIKHALRRLITLGALEYKGSGNMLNIKKNKPMKDESKISELGRLMALYPVSPRFAKMLALSSQHSLLPYTVALVAALTVPEVLIELPLSQAEDAQDQKNKWQKRRLSWSGSGNFKLLGDPAVLLRAIGEAEYVGADKQYCDNNGLRHKGIIEIRKLRRQLTNEINVVSPTSNLVLDPKMSPPTDDQARLLRQILLLGQVDHIARKVNEYEVKDPADRPKWRNAYRSVELEEPVFLPTTSVLSKDKPQWVVYQDIYESNKLFMRGITAIQPEWLPILVSQLCTFSAPLETPTPRYDPHTDKIVCHRTAKFGPACWDIPETEVEYPHGIDLFKWIAYYLLIGEICETLKPFVKYLDEPKTLISPVAVRFREQREQLLRALMSQDITSLNKLKAIWIKHPKYLLSEYLCWVRDDLIKEEIRRIWPPTIKKSDWD